MFVVHMYSFGVRVPGMCESIVVYVLYDLNTVCGKHFISMRYTICYCN